MEVASILKDHVAYNWVGEQRAPGGSVSSLLINPTNLLTIVAIVAWKPKGTLESEIRMLNSESEILRRRERERDVGLKRPRCDTNGGSAGGETGE